MNAYLDMSILVALFTNDPLTARADLFLSSNDLDLIVSDYAAAEFSAVVARHVRTRDITAGEARSVFSSFDRWTSESVNYVRANPFDLETAQSFVRRLDMPLRAPDAINLAIAQRLGATLATFDKAMAAMARKLKIELALA